MRERFAERDDGAGGARGPNPQSKDPVNGYTGDEARTILDLEVWGGAGEEALRWTRYGHSRSAPGESWFGSAHSWRHAYQWEMADGAPGNVIINYPEGSGYTFHRTTGTTGESWQAPRTCADRLRQEGNHFYLQRANGTIFHFQRNGGNGNGVPDGVVPPAGAGSTGTGMGQGDIYRAARGLGNRGPGATLVNSSELLPGIEPPPPPAPPPSSVPAANYYLMTDFTDGQGNRYSLTYDFGKNLTQVSEPGGRFLRITYTSLDVSYFVPGRTETRTIPGPINLATGQPADHDIKVPIPPTHVSAHLQAIGEVSSSDGRKVVYHYRPIVIPLTGTFIPIAGSGSAVNPSHAQVLTSVTYQALTSVDYGDGTQAVYTYADQVPVRGQVGDTSGKSSVWIGNRWP